MQREVFNFLLREVREAKPTSTETRFSNLNIPISTKFPKVKILPVP